MDVARPGFAQKRQRRTLLWSVFGVLAVTLTVVSAARLRPQAPTVHRSSVWIGTVERGSMLRQVRGDGTLVPAEVRWIPARTSGRVEQALVEAGDRVKAGQELLRLSNPEVELAAARAASALERAEAELDSLRAELESQQLGHRSSAAGVEADWIRATLRAEADRELSDKGLISAIDLKISESVAAALTTQHEIERQRLVTTERAHTASLRAKHADVEQGRSLLHLRKEDLRSLVVRAPTPGVVQEVAVEVGQQVEPGTILARLAEPAHLVAEIRVPATLARDVKVGLEATVDTRDGLVAGTVARVDPAVRDGAVLVEIRLTSELPRGARPDLGVDGIIEIERLDDVLFVGRPAFIQEHDTTSLFRLTADGLHAERVRVRLGRTAVKTIEVVDGLTKGDRIILSDTSQWDDHDRIRLQ